LRVDERLYLIAPARDDLAEFLEAAVRGGVDIVQIREKGLADVALLTRLQEARDVTRRLGIPLVVNDRPDLAVLCEADFVHLGQGDLPVDAARRLGVAAGQSTHALEEINAAEADYIGVGPILAHLHQRGLVRFESATDAEAVEALRLTIRNEGLIPALESAHAFATAFKEAPALSRCDVVLVNQSGRGDKDIFTVANALGTTL
jgi:thiamine-phosphate diphosphorylase